ncbi:MAG: bifunctional glutamate N-acetyltransferase/amino-acid acetyltransferase ArgJ [Roseiflexaceae bacterium]
MSYRTIDDGHISSPRGFRATGVSCGLKEIKARDLALIYSLRPAHAAAVFTTSTLPAAPIYVNQAILKRNSEQIRALLINAGSANAVTGQAGLANAVECAKMAAEELEVPRDSVLLMSTGRIGTQLPMDRMRDGIRRAASELDSGGGHRAAIAILTSDTRPKDAAVEVSLRDGSYFTIAGMAKGSRIAGPRQSTMIVALTTDLAIDSRLLSRALNESIRTSFGRLILDGEASPNDGILIMANGAAECPPIIDPDSWAYGVWQEALDALCVDLAQQVARDATAGGKFVQVHVRGALSDEHAQQIARAVALSAGVRAMCAASNPDWGALLIAVGASGVDLRPDLLELRLGSVLVLAEGMPAPFDTTAAVQALSGSEVELTVDLHVGPHATTVWTCTAPIV